MYIIFVLLSFSTISNTFHHRKLRLLLMDLKFLTHNSYFFNHSLIIVKRADFFKIMSE